MKNLDSLDKKYIMSMKHENSHFETESIAHTETALVLIGFEIKCPSRNYYNLL